MTHTSQNPLRPADVHIVDLFAGPGGLDVAAHALGASSIGIEWDASACETRREAGLPTEQGDVRAFDAAKFPEANVLAGGPPCQTYTVAGKGAGRRALDEVLGFVERLANGESWPRIEADLAVLEDERTGLVLQPLHWALDALQNGRPYEAIVLEQVPAVLPVWEAFRDVLREKDYSAECGILRTEEFGVPQTRRRAVLIARYGKENTVALPSPTHQSYRKDMRPTPAPTTADPGLWEEKSDKDSTLLPWVSMGKALADHRTGPFTVISNYGTGGDPKARGRRSSCAPSATVTGKVSRNRIVAGENGPDLPRFSFREAGMLQSFPEKYPWSGKDVSQQIGNAVPPLLGLHILSAALGLGRPSKEAIKRLGQWQPPKSERSTEPQSSSDALSTRPRTRASSKSSEK
ncbi:DNA cytosine methyltransferase [Streptomyces sp. PA03-2a]|uniref:DNA cytosine methyltransferase n=1 Tax=Streptomyces sp. PA03-2a TaxID=3028701 RepID=UPI0029A15D7A|nr:DNA cytosine methyltransferase [Streptomyces sp. PA03-2a]MDX2728376.1 DNA cytosine methyltransferase [Streptomyces sp. PA03-2a]